MLQRNQRTEHSLSILDHDRRFTSPGPRALKSCPLLLGSWRKDSPRWETKFTTTSGLRVRVCVLCRLHVFTCVLLCVACVMKVWTIINYYHSRELSLGVHHRRLRSDVLDTGEHTCLQKGVFVFPSSIKTFSVTFPPGYELDSLRVPWKWTITEHSGFFLALWRHFKL